MNWLDADLLIGMRFVTDFRIVAVSAGRPDAIYDQHRAVTVLLRGETYELSLGELRTLVESGLVTETDEPGLPRHQAGRATDVAVVRSGRTWRTYWLDAATGVARFLGDFSARMSDAADAQYVAGDDEGPAAGLQCGTRIYLIVLPTCDWCGVGYESTEAIDGSRRFCTVACHDEWRHAQQ